MGDVKTLFTYSINFGEHKGIVLAWSIDQARRQLIEKYGMQVITVTQWTKHKRFNGNRNIVELV